jgi:hypothetical protein
MLFLGIAILVRTVGAGGGPMALGILVGLLFVAAGAGRLWATGALQRHRDEEDER